MDFGGQSVSLGIFSEGAVKFSKDIAIGSDFITRDLAVGLRTSIATAERIKLEHGIAHPKLLNGDNEIRFQGVDGRTPRLVKTSTMMNIILPRVEQIFTAAAAEVANSNYADLVVPVGAVLTGGGAQMRGLQEAAEQILNMPVRIGVPHEGLIAAPDNLLAPEYSTALGLLFYPCSSSWSPLSSLERKKPVWRRKILSIFEDLF